MLHTYEEELPNKLKALRIQHELTQSELATQLGPEFNQSDIVRYEKGERLPRLETAIRLAAIFRITVEAIFPNLVTEIQAGRPEMSDSLETSKLAPNGPKILAIYPSTYRLGIAVFNAFTLEEKVVHKLNTLGKPLVRLRQWAKLLSNLFRTYHPDVVVVEKLPDKGTKQNPLLRPFINMLKKFADYRGILVVEYDTPKVRETLLPKGARMSNDLLFQLVASHLPDLREYLPCLKRRIGDGVPYFSAMFLAAALGLTWLRENHTPYAFARVACV